MQLGIHVCTLFRSSLALAALPDLVGLKRSSLITFTLALISEELSNENVILLNAQALVEQHKSSLCLMSSIALKESHLTTTSSIKAKK